MAPPLPPVPIPVSMDTAPLVPALTDPVLNLISPVADVPAAVISEISPLVVVVLEPDVKVIEPPVVPAV
jgi:hypothetical protein